MLCLLNFGWLCLHIVSLLQNELCGVGDVIFNDVAKVVDFLLLAADPRD